MYTKDGSLICSGRLYFITLNPARFPQCSTALQCTVLMCLLVSHSVALQCTSLFPTVQHCSAPACFPQCSTAVQGVVVSGCCHIFPTAAVGPLRPSREDELQVSWGWGMFKIELQMIHRFSQSGRRPILGINGWVALRIYADRLTRPC